MPKNPPLDHEKDHALKSLLEKELATESVTNSGSQPPERHLLQKSTRFSESLVWDLQHSFFEKEGIRAWSEGVVPYYITSSPYIARDYAKLAMAWIEDQRKQNQEPLRILELGAGHGQFTFLFLKNLEAQFHQKYADTALPVTYVMSDISAANMDFWSSHPALEKWLEQGTLDYALFDGTRDEELQLRRSNDRWHLQDKQGPLLVIANYFFDSIPQDYWVIEDGKAGLVYAEVYETPGEGRNLDTIHIQYSAHAEMQPYRDTPLLQELQHLYGQNLLTGCFSIPHVGVECLDRLKSWCDHALTLLIGDKGVIDWQQYAQESLPTYSLHGSLSTQVNFHAFQWLTEATGGESWLCGQASDSLKLLTCTWDKVALTGHLHEVCMDLANEFSPADQFALKQSLESNYNQLPPNAILAYLRFSQFDLRALRRALPRLTELANTLSVHQKNQLRTIAERTWENYYYLEESDDLAFMLGSFFYELDDFITAHRFFERSIVYYGPDEGTVKNLESCEEMLASGHFH